jgi:toxin ParE1/3/4
MTATPRYRLIFTEGARRDLQDIYRFLVAADSVTRADSVLNEIENACYGLLRLPERGNMPKELLGLGANEFREVHSGPFRIVYRVHGRRVLIYCIFDGRRDVQALLQRRLLR